MRAVFLLVALTACAQAAPQSFPDSARQRFAQVCPSGDARCDCAWEKITQTMSPEDFNAAVARLDREGLIDPRLVRAREECLNH
jgi:predicted small lipoprotein YifL